MRTFIIDGAYSIDAQYRKWQSWPWNPQEQLSEKEKEHIKHSFDLISPDIILSHTCPITWRPTDLFSPEVDQTTVDSSMELFLEEIAEIADYKTWCWGHFHETREYEELEGKPGRKRIMIFQDFIPLEEIVD
jgi:3-oxoacid CoA-transferase subunit A